MIISYNIDLDDFFITKEDLCLRINEDTYNTVISSIVKRISLDDRKNVLRSLLEMYGVSKEFDLTQEPK